MSEATVETGENVETEETVETFDASTLDEFGQQFVAKTTAQIERLNTVTAEIKANSTNPAEIAEGIYDTLKSGNKPDGVEISDKVMEQYNKAQEIVEKAMAHFREVSETVAKERAAKSENAEVISALTAEREALEKKVRQARNLLSLEYPGAETLLPDVARSRGGSGGSGRGAGGRKLRGFTVTVNGEVATLPDGDGNKKSSFSAGAKVLGIPTADLQRAYMVAAGTENADEFPQTLTLDVPGADGKSHSVKIDRNPEK